MTEFVTVVMVEVTLDEWREIHNISMAGVFPESLYRAVEKVLGREAVERIRDKPVAFSPAPAALFPRELEKRFSVVLYPKDEP